ncbi:TIGR01777 family oxidoreductase [Flammeovirga sp. EKP202]|uniref:TIGR01777 family oxidoreductase n=1 Tax=Flammeovirga sp. EKP202 TaxID=2770592 RepID=UPI00165FA68A|nr:TIGR01777 family oxidoreductase [Flammeovirga sp. EKP202]MBD0404170.1 TIGR01777 family protein [Flammeovirga sp. EKP202]
MKILITGGSGLVGKELSKKLIRGGHKVSWLSRKEDLSKSIPRYKWDLTKKIIDKKAFEGVDVVVHLAGKNVGEGRWTPKAKEEILNSRVVATTLLMETINALEHPPKTVICASAIGYYGDRADELVDEGASAGTDFLADVVRQWEEAMDILSVSRLVKLRLGVVLSNQGGALSKIIQPIKMGVGAALGSGDQWMSWISLEDIVRLIIFSIENDQMKGTYNAVTSTPLTNKEMTKRVAKFYHRPLILPNVPVFVLKLLLGESVALVLNSTKVKSLDENLNFDFKNEEIETVLV